MESFQGPIEPCNFSDHFEANSNSYSTSLRGHGSNQLREGNSFSSSTNFNFLLEDKIPFLQMLQSVELPSCIPFKEPCFQSLMKLQHLTIPSWDETHPPQLEPESCVTLTCNHMTDHLYSSSVKSETFGLLTSCCEAQCKGCFDFFNKEGRLNSLQKSDRSWTAEVEQACCNSHIAKSSSPTVLVGRGKRKRKRTRPTKNKDELESQRMTHIAVERNRRRLMNEYISSLRSLMPPSYIQRGDQASIIGGAIDFVKDLEQVMQSLEDQKKMKNNRGGLSFSPALSHFYPEYTRWSEKAQGSGQVRQRSNIAEIEVTVVKDHVNLKVHCERMQKQLLKAIIAIEELKLTILHLNINSASHGTLYSFNLKLEEDCKIRTADEIACVANQIFSIINNG